jgi:hypothetical protein
LESLLPLSLAFPELFFPVLVDSLGVQQPLLDEINVALVCLDALRRFFLEDVENEHHALVPDRVDSAIRAAVAVDDDLYDLSPAEAFEGLCVGSLTARHRGLLVGP